jgi:hypothetical protein
MPRPVRRQPNVIRPAVRASKRGADLQRRFLPLILPPLPFISIEKVLTGMSLAPGTQSVIDFTDAAVATNDGGESVESKSTSLSPFAGDYFSFDWSANSHRLHIDAPGIYLLFRFWSMISYDHGSLTSPALISLEFNDALPTGFSGAQWEMANAGANGVGILAVQSLTTGDPDVPRELSEDGVLLTPGGVYMTSTISHWGQQGDLNEAAVGMAALRLGDYSS